jgi:hypothetical protein
MERSPDLYFSGVALIMAKEAFLAAAMVTEMT